MTCVTLHRHGDVAVVEIDNPPVNATSQAVRQGLKDAIVQAGADAAIGAVVIAGAGRTFTAGGDITEFGKLPREPHLPEVLDLIEASDKPVVAAWHGTALGGGCEIGLATHRRIIAKGGQVGLPEVKLGLLPGAGGTQRLPRLVGAAAALDMIATGRMVPAQEALTLGLVDAIADGDLRQEAIILARSLIGSVPDVVSVRPVAAPDAEAWEAATQKVRRAAKGQIAPLRAIELVSQSVTLTFAEGRALERRAFFELMASDASRALRHLFRAEREASRLPELAGIAPQAPRRHPPGRYARHAAAGSPVRGGPVRPEGRAWLVSLQGRQAPARSPRGGACARPCRRCRPGPRAAHAPGHPRAYGHGDGERGIEDPGRRHRRASAGYRSGTGQTATASPPGGADPCSIPTWWACPRSLREPRKGPRATGAASRWHRCWSVSLPRGEASIA